MLKKPVAVLIACILGVGCSSKQEAKRTVKDTAKETTVLQVLVKLQKENNKLQQELLNLKMDLNLVKEVLVAQMNYNIPYVLRNFKATFYSNDSQSINVAKYRDGLTATRIPVGCGVIAVDSKIIPLGSVVYIPQLDRFFVALDVGSGVKGKHIDIYVNSREDAIRYGVFKHVDVVVCAKFDYSELRDLLNKLKSDYSNLHSI